VGLFQLRRRRKKSTPRKPRLSRKSSGGLSHVRPTPSREEVGPKWRIFHLRRWDPSPQGGVSLRVSLRWFVSGDQLATNSVPYIDASGKLSIYTLYRWTSYPAQIFASMVSTSYTRMMNLLLKRHSKNFRYVKGLRNACIKVALCYIITHNDYIIDRFLGMTRRKAKAPKRVVNDFAYRCVCNLDGDKRFVYSQAYLQANWLKFLVKRPSDKSRGSSGQGLGSHLKGLSKIWELDLENMIPVSFKETISFFETFRPSKRHRRQSSVQSLCRSETPSSGGAQESLKWFTFD
jgi:hypothetical protein